MGSYHLAPASEGDLVAVAVACVVSGVALCFFSYR